MGGKVDLAVRESTGGSGTDTGASGIDISAGCSSIAILAGENGSGVKSDAEGTPACSGSIGAGSAGVEGIVGIWWLGASKYLL